MPFGDHGCARERKSGSRWLLWTVMLLAVHIAFQFRRMWNEEAILSAVFPHYATYKKKLRKSFPEFTD